MFMGSNQNNNNGVNINSRLFSSFSETAMVTLGAWNLQLSLKIHPVKGVNADGIRQYAQDNTEIINTSLTEQNATALLDGIKEKLDPAIKENRAEKVSVSMGAAENRKVLSLETDGKDIYLEMAINVNENGVAKPENVIRHKFPKKNIMIGYDPLTGNGEIVEVNSDYENFVIKLKDIYKFSPAVAHSINYNNAVKASYSNKQAANNQMNNYSNGGGYSAPTNNIAGDNMADFLPFN